MEDILSLATIENVSLGHPDRQTELIADAVLDEVTKITKDARVAIEITGTGHNIAIGGEVNTQGHVVDMDALLKRAVHRVLHKQKLGDFAKKVNIINMVVEQSPEITNLVEKEDNTLGAGDQGHMWSYALNAPEYNYLPEAFYLTEEILRLRDKDFYTNPDTVLGADAKVQITWNPLNGKVHSVVMSTQHTEDIELDELRAYVKENFIKKALKEFWHDDIILYINYAGSFVKGGIEADSSAVGRKLAITTAMGTVGGYLNNNGSLYLSKIPMSGGASCVDGDTEYMNSLGEWKKIKDYDGGKVAQWNEDGTVEFVEPLRYINEPIGGTKMYHIKRDNNLDMMLTGDHEVVYYTSKGNLNTKTVDDLIEQHEGSVTGFKGLIPVSYKLPEGYGGKGVDLTDDEIRLQVSFSADGHLPATTKSTPRVRIKNKDKVERLRTLLEKTNTYFGESVYDGEPDYTYFRFEPPVRNKNLHKVFINANKEQLKVIADEVMLWDGDKKGKVFRTSIKEEADFIQGVFTSVFGVASSISVDDRLGETYGTGGKEYIRKSIAYEVRVLQHKTSSIKNKPTSPKIEIKEVSGVDRKYCFTVPSGMLVLRRNNKVFVTHNCGKDPSKVDRSGHLMARYLAKNIVASTGIEECLVQLSYVIGKPEPTSVLIQSGQLSQHDTEKLNKQIAEQVDLTPQGIIDRFNLQQPIWMDVTWDGQFCNPDRPWEQLDLTFKL